ncbi:MAG TPA: hypothetical protein PLR06_03695 [Cyclobacteriaceae bacterium]|nr:hypothetical protein [Cyclobacteriaceae bacterium]
MIEFKITRNLIGCVMVWISISAFHAGAQDFKRQYKNAKDFFNNGKYNLAMESFKPLLVYDKDNPYIEYASFYYAQSALRVGYNAVAKDMLMQIKKLYPTWDQMNEVNYWLAKIYFDRAEYFQGMRVLREVKQEDMIEIEEITKLKKNYIFRITDPEVLRMMWEEYPNDAVVGDALAKSISMQPGLLQDRVLLDTVIRHFGLPREKYASAAAPLAVMKEKYNVSLLFPFLYTTLDPSPGRKQNQFILDLYEGMRMANDTLKKTGIHINLIAYDTERDPERLRQLLNTPELQNTDLIIGPLLRDETKVVQQFSEKFQINMINPVSNSMDFVGQDPFAFLFQPSLETLGARSAELIAARMKNKNCMVMYSETAKDSTIAANFLKRAGEIGLKVVWFEGYRKETAARIISTLASPVEFDKYKNPIQFRLKIDSIGSIFVASDDPLIYTKVISSVETRRDSVVVVGSETWLDNPSVDLTKYERLHVMLMAPNFTPFRQPAFIDFRRKFINTHGLFPPEYMNYTRLGYDFMIIVGQALKKYGVYFQEGLIRDGLLPGRLSRGYKLSPHRDNQEFPFIYFRQGELVAVE